jgi:hypothetical protein
VRAAVQAAPEHEAFLRQVGARSHSASQVAGRA